MPSIVLRRRPGLFRSRVLAAVCLAAGLAGSALGVRDVSAQAGAVLPSMAPVEEACGMGVERARALGFRPLTAVVNGDAVSFEQSPAILSPDYAGAVTLRRFLVAGDYPSIQIRLANESRDVESWPRVGTEQIAGRTVSIFEPAWAATTFSAILRGKTWGWDSPAIPWGELLPPSGAGTAVPITLRMAPSGLPGVRVQRVAADVQYSSSVVNIVLPEFGSQFIRDDHGFELTAVGGIFYQHFTDTYDSLAVIPHEMFFSDYGAFHRNVRNDVKGIGLDVFNDGARYGSQSGRLHSVEVFSRASFVSNYSSAHEIAHQWASYIDWTKLTGLTRAGHQPFAHDPLWAEGETFIGSVLSVFRRVKRSGTTWEVEGTPAPARFHPMTLYAMGLIGPEQVPEITLFDEQGQFDAEQAAPGPGQVVAGATRTATVYNVIGMVGPREGPVHREWHRAAIVVSRQLLTQREMDYWTFFAQRLGDPNRTGLPAYLGTNSFEEAARRLMDLRTDIIPLTGDPIVEPLAVDAPSLGRRDFRDVIFDAPPSTRYRAGERVTFSGVVDTVVAERTDFSSVTLRLFKRGGTSADAIRIDGNVSSAGTFSMSATFEPRQRGVYEMGVYLFWPGSGGQNSRVSISPITIE